MWLADRPPPALPLPASCKCQGPSGKGEPREGRNTREATARDTDWRAGLRGSVLDSAATMERLLCAKDWSPCRGGGKEGIRPSRDFSSAEKRRQCETARAVSCSKGWGVEAEGMDEEQEGAHF